MLNLRTYEFRLELSLDRMKYMFDVYLTNEWSDSKPVMKNIFKIKPFFKKKDKNLNSRKRLDLCYPLILIDIVSTKKKLYYMFSKSLK